MLYKYSQLTKKVPYEKSKKIIETLKNKPLHWGQLKLFLSELLFLSMFNTKAYTILYVGAAEGDHIAKLAEMFFRHKFILYDPRNFSPSLKKYANIEMHNKYFTDDEAKKYKKDGSNILFISDIRISEYGKYKTTYSEKSEEFVIDDMQYQMDWCKIIKPKKAYLKFRTMYIKEKFDYFDGTIYLQQYSPVSTESRLLTDNYDKLITYDSKEFDEKMAYYNCCMRPTQKSVRWTKVMEKLNLKNTLDMENMLYILEYYLIKEKGKKKDKSDNDVIELFKDIGNFFKKMNIDKYNKLLVKTTPITIKIKI